MVGRSRDGAQHRQRKLVVVRGPDGEETLQRGDLTGFPAGPAGAHKVMNRSDVPARTLMFSCARVPAISVYPDSAKIGVWSGNGADDLVFTRDPCRGRTARRAGTRRADRDATTRHVGAPSGAGSPLVSSWHVSDEIEPFGRTRMWRLRPFVNRYVNPVTRPLATRLPSFAVLTHRGRKSGRTYRTPINVFRRGDHYFFYLTYGSDVQWVRNVLATGSCSIETRGLVIELVQPELITDPELRPAPAHVRFVERRVAGVDQYLRMRAAPA
jgi:deazaflavin-dependent oxidoreductase (nitroreductase family)